MLYEIYKYLIENKIELMYVKDLLLNKDSILNSDNFVAYYKILNFAIAKREDDFVEKFIQIVRSEIENGTRKTILRYYAFIYDKEFDYDQKEKYFDMFLRGLDYYDSWENDDFFIEKNLILLNEINKFRDVFESSYIIGIKDNYNSALSKCELKPEFIDFHYLNNNISDECLLKILDLLDNSKEVYEKLIRYLNENLSNKFKLKKFDKKYFKLFEFNLSQIYVDKYSLDELSFMFNILMEKLGMEGEFPFSEVQLNAIIDYLSKNRDVVVSDEFLNKIGAMDLKYNFKNFDIDEKIVVNDKFSLVEFSRFIDNYIESNRKDIKLILSSHYVYYDKVKDMLGYNNVFINYGGVEEDGLISLDEYIKAHKFYDGVVDFVNMFYFSPLEAYFFAYILTKNFKKYRVYKDSKEVDEKYSHMSRNFILIVGNEYIVCEGFVNFIDEILKRLNYSSSVLSVKSMAHARIMVYLKDDKYQVEGVYVGDPTFDSNEEHMFKYSLMTISKEDYINADYNDQINFENSFKKINENSVIDCEVGSDDFYEIINKKIPPEIIKNVFFSIFGKLYPSWSFEEIDENLEKIELASNFGFVTECGKRRFLNKKVKDVGLVRDGNIKYINIFDFIKLHCCLESHTYNINDDIGGVCWQFHFESIGINEEILVEVLLTLKNEYIVCDVVDGRPIIKVSVPDNFTYLMVVQEFEKYFQLVLDRIKEKNSSEKFGGNKKRLS